MVKITTRSPARPRTAQVPPNGAGEHHARSVVVRERDRSLVRARWPGRRARRGRARGARRAAPLVDDDEALVVDAERGRAGQHRRARTWIALGPALVDDEDSIVRPGRRTPRPQSGVAAADHERLDVRVPGLDRGRGACGPGAVRPRPARPREAVDQLDRGRRRDRIEPGARTSTKAHGSSDPADITPRGRPRMGRGQTTSTPFASSAEASVSPANPSESAPSNRKRTGRERSMRPPAGRRLTRFGPPARRRRRPRNSSVAVSNGVEPAPASRRVEPPLVEVPPRVVAHEQVVGPLRVGEGVGVGRVGDVRLAAVAELDLVAWPAPGARDQQHAALSSVGHRRRAVLVDQRTGREPLERERARRAGAGRRSRSCRRTPTRRRASP